MQPESLEVKFQLRKRLVLRAMYSLTVRRSWYLLLLPFIGVQTVLMALLEPQYASFIGIGWAMLGASAYFFLLVPYLHARNMMNSPNAAGPIEFALSEEGIQVRGTHASSQMDWAMIRGAMETGGCIFILVGSSWALIPKDQIPAADFVALKQILRAHCPSTARF